MNMFRIGMVSVIALATAAPVYAQQYRETPESAAAREEYRRQQDNYQGQRERYDDQRAQYDQTRGDYQVARRDYREARRDYDRRLAEWQRAQRIYDRRYGYGSYARIYSRPVWDQSYWTSNTPPPYAGYYGQNTSASGMNCSSGNNTVAGGVIGALAGAILGSQVASRGARTEGAVLGGVAGAVIGGSIGNASGDHSYKCDSRGPYFSRDDTIAYREGRNRYSSTYDYGYYTRQNCRLAAAPVDAYGRDVRYVRVCPDGDGRYRITG